MKKKYDPFLGKATTIKVKLTTLGESLLKTFTEYRPKLIKMKKIFIILKHQKNKQRCILEDFQKKLKY